MLVDIIDDKINYYNTFGTCAKLRRKHALLQIVHNKIQKLFIYLPIFCFIKIHKLLMYLKTDLSRNYKKLYL